MSVLAPLPPLQFFDSLANRLLVFQQPEATPVKLYVCGPTVYDDAHLGHARCYITWDVLYRVLKHWGYAVNYVRNVTDVDDKILHRAQERCCTPQEITQENYRRFAEDMQRLNTLPPTAEPRATAHIEMMQTAIRQLIEKDFAYVSPGGTVYFATTKKADYGKLSKKPLDDLLAGARVEPDPEKQSPLDFALWKAVPETDPYAWDFALNGRNLRGRPGWHIECSAMNFAEHGPKIDIHAGGAGLIFPHHENEIAQSEAWTGESPFSRYWLHNGFVNVSGEKMSKSLGNFATVRTLLDRYDANTLRYFLLTHHYRMPVDFTDEALEAAENRVRKMERTVRQMRAWQASAENSFAEPLAVQNVLPFWQALADDLNTPKALAELNELQTRLNTLLLNPAEHAEALAAAWAHWQVFSEVLGFAWSLSVETPAGVEGLDTLIAERLAARAAKNWAESDRIRDTLLAQGIRLLDRKDGTTDWERV